MRYNADLQIEPALAESWETVESNIWRFHLRKGVKFHDGADFTADDVVASLDPGERSVFAAVRNLPAYKSATVDDYTVDIEFTGTYPLLLNDLANIHIFDAGWLKANNLEKPTDVAKKVEGYATFHANGTGPFMVESRVPDSKTVLVVNPNWWTSASTTSTGSSSRQIRRRQPAWRPCCRARSTILKRPRCRTCRVPGGRRT